MDEKILSLKNFGIIHRNKPKAKGFGRSAKDEELSKDYKLSNVSFELYRGNRLGITGSSGGKKPTNPIVPPATEKKEKDGGPCFLLFTVPILL